MYMHDNRDTSNSNSCSILHLSMIVLILALIVPSPATIPPYPCCGFGTKVVFTDIDVGLPLNYCCHNFGFIDIGEEKGAYDNDDPVYLDMDEDRIISIDDIRITPFAGFFPGSKVARTDIEINAPLEPLINWSIAYSDLNGDNTYSLQDSIYLHNRSFGNQILSGDIRLTIFGGFLPGTRVINTHPDANLPVINLMSINSRDVIDEVAILFYNTNGNYIKGLPKYDRTDAVYLHIIASEKERNSETLGLVGANDLRLSI